MTKAEETPVKMTYPNSLGISRPIFNDVTSLQLHKCGKMGNLIFEVLNAKLREKFRFNDRPEICQGKNNL